MDNSRLNVLQLIGNLDIGGAQEVVRTLAKYLAQCGCRPVVATFKDGPLRHEIERLGIPVEILPSRRYSIVAFPLFVRDMLRIRRALVDLVRRYDITIVQTHLLRSLDFLTLTLRYRTSVRRIFWTVHNSNFALRADQLPGYKWLLGPKRFAHRLLYRWTARWVDGFIAVSDEVRAAILDTIGPVGDKIAVICNGVDIERYQQPDDRSRLRRELGLADSNRLIVVVGTLKEQKGHRYLVEAVASLVSRYSDLRILFAGDGQLRSELQAQARSLGLDDHIHFLGNRSDVPALLAASDYFVLPSLWEGLPMALIEAMASGLPILATQVSGTKQVMVDGQTGLLIPPGDVEQLRAGIVRLLEEPAQAQRMGLAARRRVEEYFSARKQAQEHLALYHGAQERLSIG